MDRADRDFRPHVARWLAGTGSLALVPFIVADLVAGRTALAGAMVGLAIGLACGFWLLGRGIYSPVLVALTFGLPATVLNAVAVARYELFITYWSFVVVMAFYLVMPRRWASTMSALMILAVAPGTWAEHGAEVGSRFAVCLVLIAVFGAVTVRLVDDRQRQLVEQMVSDPLTGALNRITLASRLALAIGSGSTGRCPALLIIDVDHFKSINDRFGHETGDDVLVGLVALLRGDLPAGTPLFRLGGEEFLAVVDAQDSDEARAVASRLIETVRTHRFGGELGVTVSIGVAGVAAGESTSDWLRRSDQALYRAKAAGRDRLIVA